MPMLKEQNIGAINWGLVAGKSNTKYAWDEPIADGSEPKLWFHEIFHPETELSYRNEIGSRLNQEFNSNKITMNRITLFTIVLGVAFAFSSCTSKPQVKSENCFTLKAEDFRKHH